MSGPGQTDSGAIQRAKLFADVDELKASLQTTLKGCEILMKTDTQISLRIDQIDERINIVNKRLRHIEKAIERLNPR